MKQTLIAKTQAFAENCQTGWKNQIVRNEKTVQTVFHIKVDSILLKQAV